MPGKGTGRLVGESLHAHVQEYIRARRKRNLEELAVDRGRLLDRLPETCDWRDFSTGLFFVARMARLKEARIRVFIVAGT